MTFRSGQSADPVAGTEAVDLVESERLATPAWAYGSNVVAARMDPLAHADSMGSLSRMRDT